MDEKLKKAPKDEELRKKAEKYLDYAAEEKHRIIEADLNSVIHELQVHQVELEIQNEDLRRTQEALTFSRDRFSRLFNFAPVGFLVLEEAGKIIDASETFCRSSGYNYNQLKDKNVFDFFSEESGKNFLGRYRAFYKNPSAKVLELEVRCSSGLKIFQAEGALIPYTENCSETEAEKLLLSFTDISGRTAADTELKQKALILENISDAVIATDLELKIIFWSGSAEKIYGYTEDEALGKNVDELLRTEFIEITQPLAQKQMAENSFWRGSISQKTKNGEKLYIDVSVVWLKDYKGKISGAMSINRDRTEQYKKEESIKKLLEEKELLLKEVHHRIKNNLNTVYGLLTIQAELSKNAAAAEALNEAANRVQCMTVLYDRLYRSPNIRSMNLNEYLPLMLEELCRTFKESSKVKIITEIEDIEVDSKKLSALGILVNELFTNSMKYAFTGLPSGQILIKARSDGLRVFMEYRDNGNGLPEGVDFETSDGFGLQLVSMLAAQLEGGVSLSRDGGAAFLLDFKL
jgi:PAS domain S-box-containing protein